MGYLKSIWEFFKGLFIFAEKVVDYRIEKLPMEMAEHEEKKEIREIKNDIKVVKATTKLGRKTKKQDRKVKKGKIIISEEVDQLAEFNNDKRI